jgi:2,3-bisphosphoglycerate-dependent phosphoglycerate mutase
MAEPRYVAFLRHGDYHQRKGVPSARQPWALTEEGIAQAQAGAALLREMISKFDLVLLPKIHSSRQLRAWQTASLLADGLKASGFRIEEIAETSALGERSLGSAANLTVAEVEDALRNDPRYDAPPKGWKSDSDYCLPLEGAESLIQSGARVARYITQTAEPGQLTVFVGHGASYRHACYHLGILNREEIATYSMFHARPSLICHQNDGTWRHLAGAWKVRPPKDEPKD